MSGKLRLTVSLVVPGDAGREIDGMRRGLGAKALQRIPPHLTLVPPVNVATSELSEASSKLRQVAAATPPLRLVLGPPRTFWPATPVVYLEVNGDTDLVASLAGRLSSGVLAPPPGRRERAFVPHVTLDQKIAPERIDAALATLSSYTTEVTIGALTLFSFDEQALCWRPLEVAALGATRLVGRGGFEVEVSTGPLDEEARAFAEAEWAAYDLAEAGEADEAFSITARVEHKVAGVAEGDLRRDLLRLKRLVVAEHLRGCGVGSHLLAATEELARGHGLPAVSLETKAGGRAEGFYRSRGYEARGLIPAWRHGSDYLVMERRIAPGR